jgi:hypothetical protein
LHGIDSPYETNAGRRLNFMKSESTKIASRLTASRARPFLLFGVMTIWVSLVRGALFVHSLATVSVVVLLALIFKFAQAGGAARLMTGGVLALYVIGVVVNDTAPQSQQVAARPVTTIKSSAPASSVSNARRRRTGRLPRLLRHLRRQRRNRPQRRRSRERCLLPLRARW